jgi:hypothetical protein
MRTSCRIALVTITVAQKEEYFEFKIHKKWELYQIIDKNDEPTLIWYFISFSLISNFLQNYISKSYLWCYDLMAWRKMHYVTLQKSVQQIGMIYMEILFALANTSCYIFTCYILICNTKSFLNPLLKIKWKFIHKLTEDYINLVIIQWNYFF